MIGNREMVCAFLLAGFLAGPAYAQAERLGAEGTSSGDWKFYAIYVVEPRLAPGRHISIKGHDDVLHTEAKDGRPDIFHRFFLDPESKTYIGYDVEVEPSDQAGSARLKFKPLSLRADQLPGRYQAAGYQALPAPGFPAETYPSGQKIAVEILRNPATGQKVVDYVEVSFEPRGAFPGKAEPRDFQVSDVLLHIIGPWLQVNGADVPRAVPSSEEIVDNKLIWMSVSGRGRFLLSLAPYPGYAFQRIGFVRGPAISFSWNGDRYEWHSPRPVTEARGNWNLYVLPAPPAIASTSAPKEYSFGAVNSVDEFLSRAQ